MAGLALDESNEEQTVAPAKRKGFLSRAFYAAISIGSGMSIGFAAKTCATALLCTAGAPAATTALVAAASAGVLVGSFHAYRGYRREKQIFRDTKFLSRQALATTMTHAALATAGGMFGLYYGDSIKEMVAEGYGYLADQLGFAPEAPAPAPQVMAEIGDLTSAPEVVTGLDDLQMPQAFEPAPDMAASQIVQESVTELEAPELTADTVLDEPNADDIAVPAPIAQPEPILETANFDVMTDIAELQMPALPDMQALPTDFSSSFTTDVFNYVSEPAQLTDIATLTIDPLPELGQPATYTVSAGDNMWKVIEAHYGLTTNADVQRYVDAIAVFNGMEGVSANHIDIGDTIQLPEFGYVATTEELQLDWRALDADTLKMKMG